MFSDTIAGWKIFRNAQRRKEAQAMMDAFSKSMAIIEFTLDGTIITANDNFLRAMGYSLGEIQGQHHRMFVEPGYQNSNDYHAFWERLGRGQFESGQYLRLGKGGKPIWIEATYNPIFDAKGHPYKVVKFATDITARKLRDADYEGQIAAIGKSMAVIEFSLDGKILTANSNFLDAIGYSLNEIVGQHHSMFVDSAQRDSIEYRRFWEKLGRGEYDSGQYLRIGKGGRQIWIQASYNPIVDAAGKYFKVVKFATDITQQKLRDAESAGQIAAIGKSMAVIEFLPDGTILTANDNFLQTLGYSLDEIKGKHHSLFVDATYRQSPEYRMLWDKLGRGEYDSGQYLRIGKGGKRVWIQASYNPILDANGKCFKVVKFAADITAQKERNAEFEGQLAAIDKSMAVIEFTLDGKILKANENFLKTMGYSAAEITGQHHGMFVDPTYRQSAEYKLFWERLGRGQYDAGQYLRLGKNGKKIWIQASYNPILDANGVPFKVVKYATDITEQKNAAATTQQAIEDVMRVMSAVASGNLSEKITRDYDGPFAQLKANVNDTCNTLTEIISNIRQASTLITSAATEIADGNSDLSQRTEEQASSLEETAASMEEMMSTVKQSTENAIQASQLAADVLRRARSGGEVVERAVQAMDEINRSSKRVADIIGVINDIAFQTNLLALNAAVEAARAGDQGRGFAVVAGEVRNLAQRSAGAAKEIKELISDSVSKVADGTQFVNQSGQTLKELVETIGKVDMMMREISDTSQAQKAGIEQVNQAVAQMDQVTQQNAALVEEATAASEAMAEQSQKLQEMVGFFRVGS
jgi:methyl-accepting chemotaxis protein